MESVIEQLEQALRLPPIQEDCHWLTCPLTELANHIVETHHEYSRAQLPVLTALAAKVNMRHGATKPELARLQELVGALAEELTGHMVKEEQVLFPIFRRMQANADAGYGMDPVTAEALLNPIRRMMEEHDDAGELLRAIRSVTNNYQPPNGACTSFQTLYAGLKQHEEDLHRHVHLENNILFPRALEMARSRAGKVA
jgi:regulator of cell morphogenesis and NO signaling